MSDRFRDILALRGRIVIFTPNATVGLTFEQAAERAYAQVITTRGWADHYAPLNLWRRIHSSREYGVLSCDQQRYIGVNLVIPATDFVWVGPTGDHFNETHLFNRYQQAMLLAHQQHADSARQWTLGVDDL